MAPSLVYLGQCADALDSLDVYDKVYTKTDTFLEAVEQAVARAPNPSPFEMGAGSLEATTNFVNGGSPFVPELLSGLSGRKASTLDHPSGLRPPDAPEMSTDAARSCSRSTALL